MRGELLFYHWVGAGTEEVGLQQQEGAGLGKHTADGIVPESYPSKLSITRLYGVCVQPLGVGLLLCALAAALLCVGVLPLAEPVALAPLVTG